MGRDRLSPKCCFLPVCRDFYLQSDDFTITGDNSGAPVYSDPNIQGLDVGAVATYDKLLPSGDEAYRLELVAIGGAQMTAWIDYEIDAQGDPVPGTGVQIPIRTDGGFNLKYAYRTPEWLYDADNVVLRFYEGAELPERTGRLRVTASEAGAFRIRYHTATILFADDAGAYEDEPIIDCGIRWDARCDASAVAASAGAQLLVDSDFEVWRIIRRGCGNLGATPNFEADITREEYIYHPDGYMLPPPYPEEWSARVFLFGSVSEPTAANPYPKPGWTITFTGEAQGSFDLGPTGLSGGASFAFGSSSSGEFLNLVWQFIA